MDIQLSDGAHIFVGKGEVKYFGTDGRVYISNEQMNWIANVALNFDDKAEKDWGVIMVGHYFKESHPDFENAGEKLLDLCVAFNNGDTYKHTYKHETNSFFDLDVDADYTRYKNLDKKDTLFIIFGIIPMDVKL